MFIRLSFQLGAPVETLGRAAAELQIRKPTRIGRSYCICMCVYMFVLMYLRQRDILILLILLSGMELRFQWDEVDAFVRQPDGSLFSWCERFHCYRHLLYGVVSHSKF